MKSWHLVALTVGLLAMTSCTPKVERVEVEPPPPEATPTPTPPPTPHPALAARERAVQLYPDLAVKDSLFNRTFMELFEDAKQRQASNLTMVDWPIQLAHRAGQMLGVSPVFPATPTPSTPPPPTPEVIYVTPKPGNSLDRGAYDMRRGVARTPRIYYP